ncbi:hypothetical protein BST61_g6328 [Cercospora zeina]
MKSNSLILGIWMFATVALGAAVPKAEEGLSIAERTPAGNTLLEKRHGKAWCDLSAIYSCDNGCCKQSSGEYECCQ